MSYDEKQSPIRVAHIVGKMVGGGVESVILNYYEHINRDKIQFDFIIDEDSKIIPEKIIDLGGNIIKIPPYQNQLKYQRELYHLFIKNQYKIVHSHINSLSVFPLFAAWRAKVPIRIAHSHSTAGSGEFKKNILKYFLRPFSRLFPTNFCACTQYAGEWLFGKKVNIKILKNAISIDKFICESNDKEKFRKINHLDNKFVVGHVGRFTHQKNHMFLIDIFNEIKNMKSNSVLLLAGTGDLEGEIREKVKKMKLENSVVFLGNREDIENIYSLMDVFVFPSFYEGLGMVAVEAQVAGVKVIASTNVPFDAKISRNFTYLSLNDSAKKWALEAIKEYESMEREEIIANVENNGYDINVAGNELTNWYLSLSEGDSIEEN